MTENSENSENSKLSENSENSENSEKERQIQKIHCGGFECCEFKKWWGVLPISKSFKV